MKKIYSHLDRLELKPPFLFVYVFYNNTMLLENYEYEIFCTAPKSMKSKLFL